MSTRKLEEKLRRIILPVLDSLELTLWGMEFAAGGKHQILRIYVEGEKGVTIDQCAKASRNIGLAMDVEDPVSGRYSLEVSSPGLERPFFSVEQLSGYIGRTVETRLHVPDGERKKFRGVLTTTEGDTFMMDVDNQEFSFRWDNVKRCNLVVTDWDALKKRSKKKN